MELEVPVSFPSYIGDRLCNAVGASREQDVAPAILAWQVFSKKVDRLALDIVKDEKPVSRIEFLQPASSADELGNLGRMRAIGMANEVEQLGETLIEFLDCGSRHPEHDATLVGVKR